MKRTLVFPIAAACCLMLSSHGLAAAGLPCGRPWQTPLASVEGTITKIYYATPPGTRRVGLHLGVQTASGEQINIHVFPKECVARRPGKFLFHIGERVKAVGSVFYTQRNRQRNICAAAVPSHALPKLRDQQTGSIVIGMCQSPPACQQICDKQCQKMKIPQICLGNCLKVCDKTSQR